MDTWDAAHEQELRANAAQYGLSAPVEGWLGIPAEEANGNVFEIRDLSRRIGASPIDIVRWTLEGMPCLHCSPLARWDIRRVTEWLGQRGVLPDLIQLFPDRLPVGEDAPGQWEEIVFAIHCQVVAGDIRCSGSQDAHSIRDPGVQQGGS